MAVTQFTTVLVKIFQQGRGEGKTGGFSNFANQFAVEIGEWLPNNNRDHDYRNQVKGVHPCRGNEREDPVQIEDEGNCTVQSSNACLEFYMYVISRHEREHSPNGILRIFENLPRLVCRRALGVE